MTTMGFDSISKAFKLSDGTLINCFILDTGGTEEFRSLTTTYYRKADAILLIYDITKKDTFDEIKDYYSKEIRERCKINIPVILIGNKLDKENERAVSRKEALDLSYKEKYKYKETSCKTNANVDNAFETLIGLWILGERKKNLVGERFNSYEIRKLKKRETGVTNISSRKNSIIVGTRRENSFFIDSKHKKTSKKKCEC